MLQTHNLQWLSQFSYRGALKAAQPQRSQVSFLNSPVFNTAVVSKLFFQYKIDVHALAGESALILIRHGESLWNEKNLFTGCVDVPLTPKGVEEAIEAGKRICNIPVDVIYTSSLIRAQMTAMLAMMQHRRKKVLYLPFSDFQ